MSKVLVNVEVPMNYELRPGGEELLILLHGYQQDLSIWNKVFSKELSDFSGTVLSVSGPYLVPKTSSEGIEKAYSWYFFDIKKREFITGMDGAIDGIKKIIAIENLVSHPKTVIGYSQGGYLAPFLGDKLTNIKRVVGVACRFRFEDRDEPFPFPLIGVHGDGDTIVDYSGAKESFARLQGMGQKGEFISIPNRGHKLTTDFSGAIFSSLYAE